MRISDWSSDVCSSDLATALLVATAAPLGACAGDNGGLFSSGDRVYNPDTVDRGARDGDRVYRDRDGRYYCKRSEEHTSELQSLMRISYAVFCLKKKKQKKTKHRNISTRNIILDHYT